MQIADVKSPAHAAIVKSRRLREVAAAQRRHGAPDPSPEAAQLPAASSDGPPPVPSEPVRKSYADLNGAISAWEEDTTARGTGLARNGAQEQPAIKPPDAVDASREPMNSIFTEVEVKTERQAQKSRERENDQTAIATAAKNMQHAVLNGYDPDKVPLPAPARTLRYWVAFHAAEVDFGSGLRLNLPDRESDQHKRSNNDKRGIS